MDTGIATDEEGDPGLAQKFLEGAENGPAIIEAEANLRKGLAGSYITTYLDSGEIDPVGRDGELMQQLRDIDINDYRDEEGVIDYDRFEQDTEAIKGKLSDVVADSFEEFQSQAIDDDWRQLEPRVKAAKDLRNDLYDVPKYEGVSVKQQKQLEGFGQSVDRLRGKVMEALGYPVPAPSVAVALGRLRGNEAMARTYNQYQSQGFSQEYINALKSSRSVLEPFFPYFYDSATELAAIGAISELAPGEKPPKPSAPGKPSKTEAAEVSAIMGVLPSLINQGVESESTFKRSWER
jgi:hypothetical protein